jgi:hypothetical protein
VLQARLTLLPEVTAAHNRKAAITPRIKIPQRDGRFFVLDDPGEP